MGTSKIHKDKTGHKLSHCIEEILQTPHRILEISKGEIKLDHCRGRLTIMVNKYLRVTEVTLEN